MPIAWKSPRHAAQDKVENELNECMRLIEDSLAKDHPSRNPGHPQYNLSRYDLTYAYQFVEKHKPGWRPSPRCYGEIPEEESVIWQEAQEPKDTGSVHALQGMRKRQIQDEAELEQRSEAEKRSRFHEAEPISAPEEG